MRYILVFLFCFNLFAATELTGPFTTTAQFNKTNRNLGPNGLNAVMGTVYITNLNGKVTPAGASTSRELTARFADYVNAKDFGASGLGTASDTAAINAAILYGQTVGKNVFLPAGTNLITSPLIYNQTETGTYKPIQIIGAGINSTIIRADATFAGTAMLLIGSTTNDVSRGVFSDFFLQGMSVAAKGVYAPNINHCHFNRIKIQGTTNVAFDYGYGWDVSIEGCEFSFGADGLRQNIDEASGGNNAFYFHNNKVFSNTGVGLTLASGYMMSILGNTIEGNTLAGILVWYGANSLNIKDNYFEANSTTGWTFTNTANTVKADIILNGSGSNRLIESRDFASEGVNIHGNYTSANHITAFVKALAVDGLSVIGNTCIGTSVPLVDITVDNNYGNVTFGEIKNNKGFTTPISLSRNAQYKSTQLSTFDISQVQARNYLTDSVFDYVQTAPATSGRLVRGDLRYNGRPTLKIDNSFSGSTDFWVKQLDMADYPELAGQTVWMGAYFKHGATNMGSTAYISGLGESDDSLVNNTNWHWTEIQRTLPASGVVSFGFRRIGGGTNVVYVARPSMGLVGTPRTAYYRDTAEPTYRSSSPPSYGNWEVGNFIFNSSTDLNAELGWSCVAAGTPGTWLAVGRIADDTYGGRTFKSTNTGTFHGLSVWNTSNAATNTFSRIGNKVNTGAYGITIDTQTIAPYDTVMGLPQGTSYLRFRANNGGAPDVWVSPSGQLGSDLLTASRAVVTDSGKGFNISATTATEIGYVSGVTNSIQPQINQKQASFTTAIGVTNIANVLSIMIGAGDRITLTTNGNQVLVSATVLTNDITIPISDTISAITTGLAKQYWDATYALNIKSVRVTLGTASSVGTVTINVKKNGSTIFSTKPTIDATETSTATAATPSVLSVTTANSGDRFTFDIDGAGSSADAVNCQVTLFVTPQ